MRIAITHNSKTYVAKKGTQYGWVIEVLTPTVKEGAKKVENKESYFFPNLELVYKKLTWLGVDATEVEATISKHTTNTETLKDILESAL